VLTSLYIYIYIYIYIWNVGLPDGIKYDRERAIVLSSVGNEEREWNYYVFIGSSVLSRSILIAFLRSGSINCVHNEYEPVKSALDTICNNILPTS
jgi:hypothetical protein